MLIKKKDELNKKNNELKKKFIEQAKIINGKSINFNRESKENGDLYGSIKPKEIANLLNEKYKAEISPSHLLIKDDLNKLGAFNVELRFHSEVSAKIIIKIEKIKSA